MECIKLKSIFLHPDTFTPVLTILYTGNRTENGVYKSIFLHPDMFTPLLTILYAGQGMECKKDIFLHPDTFTHVLKNLDAEQGMKCIKVCSYTQTQSQLYW